MSALQYKWIHKYFTILQHFIFLCRQKLHQFFTIHIPAQNTVLTACYAPSWHKHQPYRTGVISFKWQWQKFDVTLWAMKDKIFKNCKIFVDLYLNILTTLLTVVFILTLYTHIFDRICCTCVPSYIPFWWWPNSGRNMSEGRKWQMIIYY
jgi:hypothetical protein